MKKNPLKIIIFSLILIFVDQLLKYIFFVQKNNAYLNTSMSFGIAFPYPMIISIPILLLVCYYYFKTKNAFLFLIIIGGISNLIDRLVYGGVVDYINMLGLFKNNLADIYISMGLFFLFFKRLAIFEQLWQKVLQ